VVKVVESELDLWVMRLVQENMPIFNDTVQCVAGTASDENSSLSELAWSILKDPTLTAQVIKFANSTYYNPYSKRISTVSRAVMRLGFNMIKEICLSIALIETVVSGPHKEKLALEVARAFHAAIQARSFAIRRNLPGPEEVFIGALLTRIGNIAFWCFAGDVGEKLESALTDFEREDQAETKVLGFKLERLTLRLNQEWKLSELLESALHDNKGIDPRIRSIKLGCAVARASEEGWDCPRVMDLTKEVGDFLFLSQKETTETLHESARVAAEIMESYGAGRSVSLVPLPMPIKLPSLLVEGIQAPEVEKIGRPGPPPLEPPHPEIVSIAQMKHFPRPDAGIQLCSLRDLSSLVTSGKADLNMVLSIVLEGIYRGIGMDRVLFALLTPDRQHLNGKYGLGWEDEGYIQNVKIGVGPEMLNVFGYLLRDRKPLWVTARPDNIIKPLLTEDVFQITGGGPFFAMPLAIKATAIGIIYSDRNLSRRELDEESYESFTFFGRQANMSLSVLPGI
jgi:HD-like signal output (HDOD) protein